MIKTDTTNTLSQVITALRFPLIVLVLFVHSNFKGVSFAWDNALKASFSLPIGNINLSLGTFIDFISGSLAPLANPFFFFISGLLFFHCKQFTRKVYINKLRHRLQSLLIPYILWNLLFLLIIAIGSSLRPGWTAIIDKPLSDFTLKDYLLIFWNTSLIGHKGGIATPIDIPLWFVRNLMVLSLASPLIYTAIRFLSQWHKRLALYVLIIFLYAIHYLPDQWEEWGQSLLFFSLGATFSIQKWDVTKMFKSYGIYGIIGACFFYWAQLTNLMYAALIVTIISLTTHIIDRRQQQGLTPKLIPNILTDSSFFIYAAHTPSRYHLMVSQVGMDTDHRIYKSTNYLFSFPCYPYSNLYFTIYITPTYYSNLTLFLNRRSSVILTKGNKHISLKHLFIIRAISLQTNQT